MKSPMTRSRAGSSVRRRAGQGRGEHEEVARRRRGCARRRASRCARRPSVAIALGPRQVADHLGQALVLVHVGGVGGLERAQHEALGAERRRGERASRRTGTAGRAARRQREVAVGVGRDRGSALVRCGCSVTTRRPAASVAAAELGGIRRLPIAHAPRAASSGRTPKSASSPSIQAACSPAGRARASATIGVCSSTPAMWRSAALGAAVVVATRAGALDLGVEDAEDVLAQGDDRGGEVALLGGGRRTRGRRRRRSARAASVAPSSSSGAWILMVSRSSSSTPGTSTTSGATLRGRPRSMTSWRACAGSGAGAAGARRRMPRARLAPDGEQRPVDHVVLGPWCR